MLAARRSSASSSSALRSKLLLRLISSGNDPAADPGGGGDLRRTSPLGIQMLSKPLYDQIFGSQQGSSNSRDQSSAVAQSIEHLKAQGLREKRCSALPEVDLRLPPTQGKNLGEHFRSIARSQGQPYLDLAMRLVRTKPHPMPAEWSSETGWTRYDPMAGGRGQRVECPADDALVLDVETCVVEGQRPILAVAVSPSAWYSWTSPRMASSQDFFNNMQRSTTLDDLIPMEPANSNGGVKSESSSEGGVKSESSSEGGVKSESSSEGGVKSESNGDMKTTSWERPKLVVGHHVSYDRARLKEQYLIKVRREGDQTASYVGVTPPLTPRVSI